MIPLSSLFLWMLPLAALPILFHLFFRVRKRTRVFSTLLFFRRADPRLSSRKRIREWLALFLRMLMIAFLLLALARFVWMDRGRGGAVAQVLMIDNSGSMDAPAPDGTTKLRHALSAAAGLISGMNEGDTAAVVPLVDDPAAAIPLGFDSEKDVLLAVLSRLSPTEAHGSPSRALNIAADLLSKSSGARLEIHILTDLQASEWQRAALDSRPPAGTVIRVHRIETAAETGGNVSLAGLELPNRRLLAGRPLHVSAELFNPSDQHAHVRLNAVDDQGASFTRRLSVPAHAVRSIPIGIKPEVAAYHWIKAWVEDDAFAADNTACLGFLAGERQRVLCVGNPVGLGMLPRALSPSGEGSLSGLTIATTLPAELAREIADRRPTMIVCPWSLLSGDTEGPMRRFAEGGGTILLVPRPDSDGEVVLPDWVSVRADPVERTPAGRPLIAFETQSLVWQDLVDEEGSILLRGIKAFAFHPLVAGDGVTALMGTEDGRAVLTETGVGQGLVFVSGVSFVPEWTTLPLKGASLALVQNMALAGDSFQAEAGNIVAGERFVMPEGLRGSLTVTRLSGDAFELQTTAEALSSLPRAGVYALAGDDRIEHVAVRSAESEGLRQFLSDPSVPSLAGLSHEVIPYRDPDALLQTVVRERRGLELTVTFLALVFLAVVLEGIVANPRPRVAAPSGTAGEKREGGT